MEEKQSSAYLEVEDDQNPFEVQYDKEGDPTTWRLVRKVKVPKLVIPSAINKPSLRIPGYDSLNHCPFPNFRTCILCKKEFPINEMAGYCCKTCEDKRHKTPPPKNRDYSDRGFSYPGPNGIRY